MHHVEIYPANRVADSGRPRYRVVCYTCNVVVHHATTGPVEAARDHLRGRAGYEEPMSGADSIAFLGRALLEAEWAAGFSGQARCPSCGEESPDHVEQCPVAALVNHLTGEGRAGRALFDWECDWCGANSGCSHFGKRHASGPPEIRDLEAMLDKRAPYDTNPDGAANREEE